MVTQDHNAACGSCNSTFQYYLIHSGFNESAYAYCELCGRTLIIALPFQTPGYRSDLQPLGLISSHTEPYLERCMCGGRFRAGASPRCPHCTSELSAEAATHFIEANAPGTSTGFRWQQSWQGIYCIVIQAKLVQIEYDFQRRA